jgi:hypothetical protein
LPLDVQELKGRELVKTQDEFLPTRRPQSDCDGHCAASTPLGQDLPKLKVLLEEGQLPRSRQTNKRQHQPGKPVVPEHRQQHPHSQGDRRSQEVLEDPSYPGTVSASVLMQEAMLVPVHAQASEGIAADPAEAAESMNA